MKLVRKLALFVLLAFAGSTAAHAQKLEATIGSWQVHRMDGGCTAAAPFDGNSIAMLGYGKAAPGRLTLMIVDDQKFGAVKDGETVDAQLMFVNNADARQLETRWSTLPATGVVLGSGKHAVTIAGPSDGLLKTFSESSYFALVQGGEVLASFQLSRGPEVIQALRTCISKL